MQPCLHACRDCLVIGAFAGEGARSGMYTQVTCTAAVGPLFCRCCNAPRAVHAVDPRCAANLPGCAHCLPPLPQYLLALVDSDNSGGFVSFCRVSTVFFWLRRHTPEVLAPCGLLNRAPAGHGWSNWQTALAHKVFVGR